MSRVKTGNQRHLHHKKVLNQTKGFRMTRNRLFKVAKEALLHAGQYSFNGRKERKQNFRKLWIQRINAGLSAIDAAPSYSKFIKALSDKKITLDRKVLAYMATNKTEVFKEVVSTATK